MVTFTYTSENTTTSWYEPCPRCARQCLVTDCGGDPPSGDLQIYCPDCDEYAGAQHVRYMWRNGEIAGIESWSS